MAIIAIIEQAIRDNIIPWDSGWYESADWGWPLLHEGWVYSPAEIPDALHLIVASRTNDFKSRYWGTEEEWFLMGGAVKKSQREKGIDIGDRVVFNVDQIITHQTIKITETTPAITFFANYDYAKKVIKANDAIIKLEQVNKGQYWGPVGSHGDYIVVPLPGQFAELTDFYHTLFHELVHWTAIRVKRRTPYEEFVADMTAGLLALKTGLPPSNQNYTMKPWLNVLPHLGKIIDYSIEAFEYLVVPK